MSPLTRFLNEYPDPEAIEKLLGKPGPADGPMDKLRQLRILLQHELITQEEHDDWRNTILAIL